jgi:hypothetical protein
VRSPVPAAFSAWVGEKEAVSVTVLKSSAPHLLMLWGSQAMFAPLQPVPATLALSPFLVEQSVGAAVLAAEFKTIIR